MMIITLLFGTLRAPDTDIAMRHRVWIFALGAASSETGDHSSFELPVVDAKVCNAITLGNELSPMRSDTRELGLDPLDFGDQLGIETQLQDSAAFGLPDKLSVSCLV